MLLARSSSAAHPRTFGRGPARDLEPVAASSGLSEDFKLFLTTFAAGFVFVSVFFG
jgi:hypothetical protein